VSQAEYERAHREYLKRAQLSHEGQETRIRRDLHVFRMAGKKRKLMFHTRIVAYRRIVRVASGPLAVRVTSSPTRVPVLTRDNARGFTDRETKIGAGSVHLRDFYRF